MMAPPWRDDHDQDCLFDSGSPRRSRCLHSAPSDRSAARRQPVGKTAADAIPISSSGRFAGIVWPSSSVWFQFTYVADQKATIWVAYLPTDSVDTDVGVYSGAPDNLVQDTAASERYTYILYHRFSAHDRRDVYVRVMNDHPDRAISFVGQVEPSSALQGPTPASVPILRAIADTPDVAIEATGNGVFLGVLAPQQTIWHRFYYGAPGHPGRCRG